MATVKPTHYLLTLALALGGCESGGEEEGPEAGGSDSGGSAGSSGSGGETTAGSMNGEGAAPSDGGMASDGGAPSASAGSSSGGSGGSGTAGTSFYLPCESAADCKMYGGGKVCCVAATMHFCTKPSACSGEVLP
jgi:hypothetical protein